MTIHIICVEYILEILALLLFYYIQINKNVTRQSDVTVVLLTSNFFYDRMVNVTSCYDTAIEWTLNIIPFDVRIMWLERHL